MIEIILNLSSIVIMETITTADIDDVVNVLLQIPILYT